MSVLRACSWCGTENEVRAMGEGGEGFPPPFCTKCNHNSERSRADCDCEKCQPGIEVIPLYTAEERHAEAIPQEYLERYLKDAKDSLFYGIPVLELTRDELVAAFMWACADAAHIRKQAAHDREVLSGG